MKLINKSNSLFIIVLGVLCFQPSPNGSTKDHKSLITEVDSTAHLDSIHAIQDTAKITIKQSELDKEVSLLKQSNKELEILVNELKKKRSPTKSIKESKIATKKQSGNKTNLDKDKKNNKFVEDKEKKDKKENVFQRFWKFLKNIF